QRAPAVLHPPVPFGAPGGGVVTQQRRRTQEQAPVGGRDHLLAVHGRDSRVIQILSAGFLPDCSTVLRPLRTRLHERRAGAGRCSVRRLRKWTSEDHFDLIAATRNFQSQLSPDSLPQKGFVLWVSFT